MTAEWVTALSSLATFIVIGASAIAALIQIRHARNSNQIAVFNEMRHQLDSKQFQNTLAFIRKDLSARVQDADYRRDLLLQRAPEWQAIKDVANFFDQAAVPVKHGMVDRDLACDVFYLEVVSTWDGLAPLTASMRELRGYRLWEDFEYFALLCKNFRKRYPNGTFPRRMRGLPLPEPWPESYKINTHPLPKS